MKTKYRYNPITEKVEKVEEDEMFQFKGLITNPVAKKQEQQKPDELPDAYYGHGIPDAIKAANGWISYKVSYKSAPAPAHPWDGAFSGHKKITKFLLKTACGCTSERDYNYNSPPPKRLDIVLKNSYHHNPSTLDPAGSYLGYTTRPYYLYEVIEDPSGFLIAVYHEELK